MNENLNLKYSIKSMVDDFGRVFFYNDKVYRAIYKDSINDCIELLDSELFKELINNGLIPKTKISNFNLEGFELILEHEKLREIQQHEWSFEMFKNAALTVLKINQICNKHGYELKDAHTFNVLFRGTNPVYADFGSITKRKSNDWIAYKEFYCVFYLPLLFWSKKEIYIVRKLVESNFYRMQTAPFQNILDSKLVKILDENPYSYHLKFRNRILINNYSFSKWINFFSNTINNIISFLVKKNTIILNYEKHNYNIVPHHEIQNVIENILQPKQLSEWAGYHQSNYSNNEIYVSTPRFSRIIELIKKIESEVNSVIDLAGNEGFFSQLIAEHTKIPNIVLLDYDSNAIDVAYKQFSSIDNNRISVGVLNFVFTLDIENTAKRFKSDLVFALAVTHHLILTQNYSLDVIFERLTMFSNKYVFVEFMPLGLWSIHTKTGITPPDWYTYEWFNSKFENYFITISIEKIEENRILFIGKLKK